MSILVINIDGYIGPWGYSKQWLAEMLKGHEKSEVHCSISSLGGSVDHALAMHDMFKTHGNVHVKLSGFNASAATVVAMGAKTRRISKYGFFLIHKVLSWIDAFGYMNEDDIADLLTRLEKEKDENAKMTLVLAQLYHDETQKPVASLLNLMKEDTWLNADEALEWGFVNEVYTPAADEKSAVLDMSKAAMIASNGLPPIPVVSFDTNQPPAGYQQSFVDAVIEGISNFFKPKNKAMTTQFLNINRCIEADGFEMSDEGAYFNSDQLAAIEMHLAAAPDADRLRDELNSELTDMTTQRNNAQLEIQNLQSQLDNALALLNEVDTSVAQAETIAEKIQAIRTLLAQKPGAGPAGLYANEDPDARQGDGVDWETLNSLPHMKEE